MPLHPPTGSALTAPVYFGVRLNSSRVHTPELLRAHLQTVRQTLQCDFIVIPTASANSLASSKRDAARKSENALESSADNARDFRITDGTANGPDYQYPVRVAPVECPGSSVADERSSFPDPRSACGASLTSPPLNHCPAGKREDNCVSPLTVCPAPTPPAESIVLVESPLFATARATVPAQHLAEAATDFPGFCRRHLKDGTCASRGARGRSGSETPIQHPVWAMPSFKALDGGLATLPAAYSFDPSTESDLPLDSQTWNAAVVCELSSWISPDVGVLPRRRRLATVSPVTQAGYAVADTVNAGPSVFTSFSPSTASSAPEACRVEGASVLLSNAQTCSYCPVAAASPEPCCGTACTSASSDDADVYAPQRLPVTASSPAQPHSEEAVKGPEKETHYSKRSRTAPVGGGLKSTERVEIVGEQHEAPRGIAQGHSCSHDRQHGESPDLEVSCADERFRGMQQNDRDGDYCAAAQATPPAVTANAVDKCASAPSPGASVRPAVGSYRAPMDAAFAVIKDGELASPRRGDSGAAKQTKELPLRNGLLWHWSFHETAWQREMQWATHVGAFAVITPPPLPDLIPVEYSRLLRAALNQLQPPIIWVKLPLVYSVGSQSSASFQSSSSTDSSGSSSESSGSEDTHSGVMNVRSSSTEHSTECCSSSRGSRRRHRGMRDRRGQTRRQMDPWRIWQYIKSMVGPHPTLGLCLELTPDLPDSDSELERWFAEPLRAVVLPSSLFTTSSTRNSSGDIFSSNSRNGNSANTGWASRGKGRGGNKVVSRAVGSTTCVSAGESGVCLSPRHHLFLMKCAQHSVKLIFQPDEDEEDEEALDTEQPGDVLPSHVVEQQQQVGRLMAEHFPSLSAAVGCATRKQQDLQSLTASPGRGKSSNTKTACCVGGAPSTQKGKSWKKHAPPLEETQPYISYVAQQLLQLPPLKQTDLFSAPYRDVLQSPMQPLADNLSAGNYEVFEKDPVKYLRYKEATLVRLREIWPGTSAEQQNQQQVHRKSQQYQTTKKQQNEERGELLETQHRERFAAPVAIGSSTEDVVSRSVEVQRKRTKNRRRKHGRSVCNRAASWNFEDEDDEEEFEEAADFPEIPGSVGGSTSVSNNASLFASSAVSSFPPAHPCLPCASAPLLASSNLTGVDASCWCLRGEDCTVHAAAGRRLVLTVVGAGRGPLVQAALEALQEAGIPLCRTRVFAVEKNWNAVITLRSRVRSDPCLGWRAVKVVEADMREAGDCVAERADILISELLGSFGDNELSAECLDGAQMHLLKKGGISIPSAYTSSLEPVATHTLWQAIDSYKDPKQFECTYVVNMFAKYFPSKEGPKECFYYRHPHFLLPFGDEGDSETEGGGVWGGSNSISNSRTACNSDSSDCDRYNEGMGNMNEGGLSRSPSSCANSTRNVGAVHRGNIRDGQQIVDSVSNTSKHRDRTAEPVEVLHAKEFTRDQAQGSEGPSAAWGPKQKDSKLHATAVSHTTIDARGKSKEAKSPEETGDNGIVGKSSVKGGKFTCVRETTSKKRMSFKQQRSFAPAELTTLRHRRTRLSWRMQTDAVVHGLAGYFHCCLYKNVYISIDPRSSSEGMFSWFPLFIPFRHPVYVHRNEKLEVYIARDGDEHKVWYEWAVLKPVPSEIYNHMGKYSYIGK